VTSGVRYVSCPRCGAPVAWAPESRYRPFCSERCRVVDLGAWAAEQYRVAAVENDDEIEDASPPEAPQ
jgi:endogenous inhibitor of DNA gyrase (YacG/DUF329 family)